MTFDLVILALIVLSAVAGYYSGAVRQLAHWIGIAAALLGTGPATRALAPQVAARTALSPSLVKWAVFAFLLVVLFFAASLAARVVLNLIEPGDERGPLDQGIGIVVGAAKGALILFALLCVAVTFEKKLNSWNLDIESRTKGSSFMSLARQHNLFARHQAGPGGLG